LNFEAGTYSLAVSAQGYAPVEQQVVLRDGNETVVELRMRPLPASVSGKVVDTQTQAAIVGATVTIGSRTTASDEYGHFHMGDLGSGTLLLRIQADGYQVQERALVIRPGAKEVLDVFLQPVRGSLHVRVLDTHTGDPINDALISWETQATPVLAGTQASIRSLLVAMKRSREYRLIRGRIADLKPTDSWEQDDLRFFTFELRSPNEEAQTGECDVAVFAMNPESAQLVSAVVVATRGDEGSPSVTSVEQLALIDVKGAESP
jgi:hypothetical protein